MKTILILAFILAPGLPAADLASPIELTVGKSVIIESAVDVERVLVGSAEIAEAVAVSRHEVVLNAKAPGETSLVIWQRNGGGRLSFDVTVRPSQLRLDDLRRRLRAEVGESVEVEMDNKSVVLRGTVRNKAAAVRALALAGAVGETVNLLNVTTPAAEPQVLLKVRFADIDRSASTQLGLNLISTGAANTSGSLSTQQFGAPTPKQFDANNSVFNISDALNVFLFRPDLNLAATIKALQSKNLVQILAEPNVLATAGKQASFLAGGEFPYPVVQSGANSNSVTIQFREFGIRLNFTPSITPRGTIRLQVAPEVSSLDYANGLVYQGFNIPGLAVRRIDTEIELENGQSFAIAGLLDKRLTDEFNKVPGLGDIPLFGKLFQSRSTRRNNTELLVVVTPQLVQPVPAGQPGPELKMPKEFMKEGATAVPGGHAAGPAPLAVEHVPSESLLEKKNDPPARNSK